jgi:hypothetical protein
MSLLLPAKTLGIRLGRLGLWSIALVRDYTVWL